MSWIGTDEAGKGDYFGYLVVAAVAVDSGNEAKLKQLHVRDSKRISDNVAISLAEKIKKLCDYDIVLISPEKYNKLYRKSKNLNKILAWAHARAIENLLSKNKKVDHVLIDQFCDKHQVADALMENGRSVRVIQQTHAESDTAVAAASILARTSFLLTLYGLSKKYGVRLPKGSTHVKDAAKKLIEIRGESVLDKVAKKHFKITKQILKV